MTSEKEIPQKCFHKWKLDVSSHVASSVNGVFSKELVQEEPKQNEIALYHTRKFLMMTHVKLCWDSLKL